MNSAFLREQKRYTQEELIQKLQCDESETVRILKRLKEYGVLKAVPANDEQKDLTELAEEDVQVADVEAGENEYLYVFTFVGIITICGCVLKIYPKYLFHNEQPVSELKQIIKVIEKYNSKEQIIRLFNDSADSTAFNMLAVMLWLIHDYYENGSYTNPQDIIETNGSGDILWDRTINETFTYISNNRPYYPEIYTRKRKNDDFDFFKRLHDCILTRCSEELKSADLLDLFDIEGVELTDEALDDFGETDYILDRLYKELNIQFNTRKQLVLKTMYAFVDNSRSHIDDMDCFSMFGTNSFNLIWEKVCGDILDNKMDTVLGALDLPCELCDGYNSHAKLKDIINHPFWKGAGWDDKQGKEADKSLIPDIISLYNDTTDNEYKCVISDAKYYNLTLEKNRKLSGNPGVESVTKQYLYQMAYKQFLKDHHIFFFRNCFLLPTEQGHIIDKGTVVLPFLKKSNLADIQIRLLPAKVVYEYYLDNRKMDIKELHLW